MIWENNVFSRLWRQTRHSYYQTQQNKLQINTKQAKSYRLICLHNTLCKLLEKIIDCHLTWYLENIISSLLYKTTSVDSEASLIIY